MYQAYLHARAHHLPWPAQAGGPRPVGRYTLARPYPARERGARHAHETRAARSIPRQTSRSCHAGAAPARNLALPNARQCLAARHLACGRACARPRSQVPRGLLCRDGPGTRPLWLRNALVWQLSLRDSGRWRAAGWHRDRHRDALVVGRPFRLRPRPYVHRVLHRPAHHGARRQQPASQPRRRPGRGLPDVQRTGRTGTLRGGLCLPGTRDAEQRGSRRHLRRAPQRLGRLDLWLHRPGENLQPIAPHSALPERPRRQRAQPHHRHSLLQRTGHADVRERGAQLHTLHEQPCALPRDARL